MSKPTVARIFVGSLVAIAGGLVLGLLALLFATGTGSLVLDGSEVSGLQPTILSWILVGIGALGVLLAFAGSLGQFAAWIGALVNTVMLEDKSWFLILLLLGLFSLGFFAMIAYVIAGPDGTIGEGGYHPTPGPIVPKPTG